MDFIVRISATAKMGLNVISNMEFATVLRVTAVQAVTSRAGPVNTELVVGVRKAIASSFNYVNSFIDCNCQNGGGCNPLTGKCLCTSGNFFRCLKKLNLWNFKDGLAKTVLRRVHLVTTVSIAN